MNTKQMTLIDLTVFAIEQFDTVSVKWSHGRSVEGVLIFVDTELHCNGRRACIVVASDDGHNMAPFMDQLTLVKKYIGRAVRPVAEMSDDTAARFAAYAKAR